MAKEDNEFKPYTIPNQVQPLTEQDVIGIIYSQLQNIGGSASVLPTGKVVLKNVQVGGSTLQYTINGNGILNFGDGSDGAVTLGAGTTTLTSDKYYTTLIIPSGSTLNPAGYRVFCSVECINNGTISRSGATGGNGGDGGNASADTGGTAGAAGAAGAALDDGYLKGSVAGKAGGAGSAGGVDDVEDAGGVGTAGANTSNSIGSSGTAGGAGGSCPSLGGAGGGAGTATASNVKLIANWHLALLLDVGSTGATVKYDNSAGSGSGGGGAAGGVATVGTAAAGGGGGGGGSGSSGGIIAIYAKLITIDVSASITVSGGVGGNGGNAGNPFLGTSTSATGSGGGGGGAGGNGGQIILVYNILTNNGTLTISEGTGGTKGTSSLGLGAGTNGGAAVDGANGAVGITRKFAVSL